MTSNPHPNESSESGEGECPGKEDEGEEGKHGDEEEEEEEEEDVPCAVCGELRDDDKALSCEECDRPSTPSASTRERKHIKPRRVGKQEGGLSQESTESCGVAGLAGSSKGPGLSTAH